MIGWEMKFDRDIAVRQDSDRHRAAESEAGTSIGHLKVRREFGETWALRRAWLANPGASGHRMGRNRAYGARQCFASTSGGQFLCGGCGEGQLARAVCTFAIFRSVLFAARPSAFERVGATVGGCGYECRDNVGWRGGHTPSSIHSGHASSLFRCSLTVRSSFTQS
jgi:hypothetical protein